MTRYLALATDYDGTLASHGIVDEPTVAALSRARQAGLRLLLVTGRELTDLFNTFPRIDLFDRVVAENGAVLYDPSTTAMQVLATAPPPELLTRLTRQNVPLLAGHVIVASPDTYAHVVLDTIHELGLEWHLVFNKGSVMALPAGITKASGLTPALDQLRVPAERTAGVGDAENDHSFLRMCGFAAAVANALPAIKADVDWVAPGAAGEGVRQLIDRMLAEPGDPRQITIA